MKRTYSLVIITLLISFLIYLFYRTEKTLVNELVLLFVSADAFAQLRSGITQAVPLGEPIVYSLPGGLWVFCFTMVSKRLHVSITNHNIPLVALPIIFAAGLEACQLFHFTNGTFDVWDIGFYATFWWLAHSGFQARDDRPHVLSLSTPRGFIFLAIFLSVYLAHVNQ